MRTTKHAQQQSQRRAISPELVELVIDYGREYKGNDHARMYRIDRLERRFLEHDFPKPLWRRYRDRLTKVVPIVGANQAVITAMHRFRRIRVK